MTRRENPFNNQVRRALGEFPIFPIPVIAPISWNRLPINEQQIWHGRLTDLKQHSREQDLLLALLQAKDLNYSKLCAAWEQWYPSNGTKLTKRWKQDYTKQQILLYTLGQIERSFLDFQLNYISQSDQVFCTNMLAAEQLRVYKEQKSSKDINPMLVRWQKEWVGKEQILIKKIMDSDDYAPVKDTKLEDLLHHLNI